MVVIGFCSIDNMNINENETNGILISDLTTTRTPVKPQALLTQAPSNDNPPTEDHIRRSLGRWLSSQKKKYKGIKKDIVDTNQVLKVQFQRLSELGVSFEAYGSATTNINVSITTDPSNGICYTKSTSSTNKRCEKGDTTDQLLNIGNRG